MEKIPVRSLGEPDIKGSFSIREVTTLLSEKDMVQELHRHNFFFVLVIEKGKGEHVIDFTTYPIRDYSVFFLRPGQVHQLEIKKGGTGYLMEFNADYYSPSELAAKQALRKASMKNHCQFNPDRAEKLLNILSYIFKEYTERPGKYREVIKAYLEIFFVELERQSQNPGRLIKTANPYSQERLEALLELLEIHVSTKKRVVQYAEMLHLTPYQLNAITKKTLGKTCSQLIDEQIIMEAKRNLLATSDQVSQIAFKLGYEDLSYFIRFFKKHTGFSPVGFRQNFK